MTDREQVAAQIVPLLKQRLSASDVSEKGKESLEQMIEDIRFMELMRTSSFDEDQIRQLA